MEEERAYLREVIRGSVRQWLLFASSQPWEEVRARARTLHAAVMAMGDAPDYTDPNVLNLISQAVALAAFTPGGVWYMDLHFQAKHPWVR